MAAAGGLVVVVAMRAARISVVFAYVPIGVSNLVRHAAIRITPHHCRVEPGLLTLRGRLPGLAEGCTRSTIGGMSTGPQKTRLAVGRVLALGTCAVITVVLIVWMVAGISSHPLRVIAIIVACLAVAIAVVLLPDRWRTRSAVIAGAFVGAAGIVPIFVNSDSGIPPAPPAPSVKAANVNYLASLIRQGPFSEKLPAPLVSPSLKDVRISDQSAVHKVGAAWLETGFPGRPGSVSAFIETYRTPDEAKVRTAAQRKDLLQRYPDSEVVTGDDSSFCIEGNDTWNCGATRGYVYVEVTVSPASNANLSIANETVSAVLSYCDRMTLVAAG